MTTSTGVGARPLAEHEAGFAAFLAQQGYALTSTAELIFRMRRLGRFLDGLGVEADALSPALIDAFVESEQRAARKVPSDRWLRHVLAYLRWVGALPPPPVVTLSPLDEMVGAYRGWLVVERSLSPRTIYNYMHLTRRFLAATCGGELEVLLSLTAADVAAYLRAMCQRYSARSVNEIVVALRSLFRFLYLKGHIETPLAQAVPWMASGRRSSLPRVLPPGQAGLVLSSCDRTTRVGRRDFAVLTVLVRLGLRRCEVAALELSDIDWRAGEIVVPGKRGWRDQLPLPVDVGEAIVSYLEVRGPDGGSRGLFVHVVAPHGRITPSDVGAIVRRACQRSGIPDTGTHKLRHGIATDMLAQGAPLYEIGQVLRHRDIETTAIYAKVDLGALSTLARPWPGAVK
jgi:site-specific recombinase XerD